MAGMWGPAGGTVGGDVLCPNGAAPRRTNTSDIGGGRRALPPWTSTPLVVTIFLFWDSLRSHPVKEKMIEVNTPVVLELAMDVHFGA